MTEKKGSLLPWGASARKKYPQYPHHDVQLRILPTGEHQIILFVNYPYRKGKLYVKVAPIDLYLPAGLKRDSSGVVVLAEGKSWTELGLTKT